MVKLLIYNNVTCHYEIIESVIVKYKEILNISNDTIVEIYLSIKHNESFEIYIKEKYPNIIFKRDFMYYPKKLLHGGFNGKMNHNYHYYIDCTIYDIDIKKLISATYSNKKYISHEITDQLKANPNVYFLTPLSKSNVFYTDILPFSDMKQNSKTPVYIIQGNLNEGRRNLSLLIKILEKSYDYDFIIKLVGRGYLPPELEEYKNKIVMKNKLNFIDYHKEFLDAYCILPLITLKSHPRYYTDKLTSTINYAIGYNLKCIIDQDLQNIYNLQNVEVFNNENDIVSTFEKTLKSFYTSEIV